MNRYIALTAGSVRQEQDFSKVKRMEGLHKLHQTTQKTAKCMRIYRNSKLFDKSFYHEAALLFCERKNTRVN